MPEINITLLTYIVVIIFAISGFYRGWWKEAITTIVLAFLIFLLQTPDFAQDLIETFNSIVTTIWEIVPESFKDFLRSTFGFDLSASALQADANSTNTWLTLLFLLILGAVLLNRFFLPGGIRQGPVYNVTPIGAILGALLGGLNGFIIANLILEYLTGRNLPGGAPATEIALSDGRTVAVASPGIDFPGVTILDSFVPWVIIGLGLLLLFAVLRTRVGIIRSASGFRRIDYRAPYGYEIVRYRRE
jgi:hypothetical protein